MNDTNRTATSRRLDADPNNDGPGPRYGSFLVAGRYHDRQQLAEEGILGRLDDP